MKQLLAKLAATSPVANSVAILILRLVAGGFMAFGHGLVKLRGGPDKFPADPLGIGTTMSFYGAVASEFFCCLFIMIGLFTRLACVPIIFTMAVAAFVVHGKDPLFMGGGAAKEPALVYLTMFLVILIAGPGRYSLDAAIFGRKRG